MGNRFAAILCALVGLSGLGWGGARQAEAFQPAEPDPAAPSPGEPTPAEPELDAAASEALARVLDAGALETDRLDAARRLAARADEDPVLRLLSGMLRNESTDAAVRTFLLRGLAREPLPAESALPLLTDLAGSADAERLPRVLLAAAAIRTPDSLRLVIRFLDAGLPEAIRAGAQSALVRATGQEDVPASVEAWESWLNRALQRAAKPGSSWGRVMLASVADRMDRNTNRARDLAARLVDANRRLYLANQADQRGPLLASILNDPVAEVRSLGFELLERELVAAPTPQPDVLRALLGLLSHPTPSVRAQAAVFVGRAAPESGAGAVFEALARETDSTAAGALLTAASRWPGPPLREPVLHWLENGQATRALAAEAALAMHRAEQWTGEDLERVAAGVRGIESANLTPGACRLLAAIGTDEDRQKLAVLLRTGTGTQRAAIADALADRAEHVDAIVEAAGADPALIGYAARAVATHRPTIAGFRAIARLNAADENSKRQALRRVGESLGVADLLTAADESGGDTATMLWLLERALERAKQGASTNGDAARGLLAEAAERLARQQLTLGRAAEALAAMDSVPPEVPAARLMPLRIVALSMLGRVPEAQALGGVADTWLDALERCIALPHAGTVRQVIADQFEVDLTPPQRGRLASLDRQLLAAAPAPVPQADPASAEPDAPPPSTPSPGGTEPGTQPPGPPPRPSR